VCVCRLAFLSNFFYGRRAPFLTLARLCLPFVVVVVVHYRSTALTNIRLRVSTTPTTTCVTRVLKTRRDFGVFRGPRSVFFFRPCRLLCACLTTAGCCLRILFRVRPDTQTVSHSVVSCVGFDGYDVSFTQNFYFGGLTNPCFQENVRDIPVCCQ